MTEVCLLGRWRLQPESFFPAGSVRPASGDGWNLVGALGHRACVLSNGVRIKDTQRVSHPLKLMLVNVVPKVNGSADNMHQVEAGALDMTSRA